MDPDDRMAEDDPNRKLSEEALGKIPEQGSHEIQEQIPQQLLEEQPMNGVYETLEVPQFIAEYDPEFRFTNCTNMIQPRLRLFAHQIRLSFQRHGRLVGTHPKSCIIIVSVITLLAMSGLFCFQQERNPLRLWIPEHSDFYRDTNWLMNNYGEGLRIQSVLITAPDVLEPDIMLQLLDIHMKLTNSSGSLATWQDVCFKVPVVSFNIEGPRFRRAESRAISDVGEIPINQSVANNGFNYINDLKSKTKIQQMLTDESFDPSVLFGSFLYCSIVRNMPLDCLQQNILDLWKYDYNTIRNLTKAKIVNDLNCTTFSPTLGHPISFKNLLGGIKLNDNNEIISAKAVLLLYMVHVNFSTVDMDVVGNEGGTADWANGPGLEWESKFLEIMEKASGSASGMEVYYEAGRSFGDVSASGMFQDVDKLMLGIVMMLAYILMQQTLMSWVESRIIPCIVGLLCVGLAFLTSVAVCSILGIRYGPVHTSLPFLLMGIGVDDMFVILSGWNLRGNNMKTALKKRGERTMYYAGISITITSATDFFAFLIGSTTTLPSLRSFCIYAAVGVLVTYILQSTLFLSALVLDQKRMGASKNCLLPWIQHKESKHENSPNRLSCTPVFKYLYSKVIMTKVGKCFTIGMAIFLMAVTLMGNLDLRQEFRPEWFLDQESYLYKFVNKRDEYFPDFGNNAGVYLGQLHYSVELQNIGRLVQQLQNQSDVLKNIEDWWSGFHRYVSFHHKKDIGLHILPDDDFNHYISQYLFSPSGARFQKNFRFSEPLECGKPAPNITVASIGFYFKKFGSSAESVSAMNIVKDLVRDANFTTGDRFATVWAKVFANWVTDEVISQELIRNIGLAILVVGITTVIFLGSLSASMWVLMCVLLTVLDTTGFMHFWGLTIDLVSAIALVLAVGLCVDFAAHIAYSFIDSEGTLDERAIHAVTQIGAAVLHGGITTLLALSVLVISRSYIFTAFFKIFFLVIVLGLFHGLLFLPVVLSLMGPAPYVKLRTRKTSVSNYDGEDKDPDDLPE